MSPRRRFPYFPSAPIEVGRQSQAADGPVAPRRSNDARVCTSSTASTIPAPSASKICSPASCRNSATRLASPASSRCGSRSSRETKSAPLVEMPDERPIRSWRRQEAHAADSRRTTMQLVHAHTPRTALVGRMAARKAGVPFIYHVHSPAGRDSTRRFINALNSLVEWHTVRRGRSPRRRFAQPATIHDRARLPRRARRLRAERRPLRRAASRSHAAHRHLDHWHRRPLPPAQRHRSPPRSARIAALLGCRRAAASRRRLRNTGLRIERARRSSTDSACRTPSIGSASPARSMPSWRRWTCSCSPACSAKGCRWSCSKRWRSACRSSRRTSKAFPKRSSTARSGLLVEPASVSQLASAIEEFVAGELDYSAISQRGRERHRERFSDVAMAAQPGRGLSRRAGRTKLRPDIAADVPQDRLTAPSPPTAAPLVASAALPVVRSGHVFDDALPTERRHRPLERASP